MTMNSPTSASNNADKTANDDPPPSVPSKFRFKAHKSRRSPQDDLNHHHSGKQHHSSRHRSKRHKRTHPTALPDDPSLYDDTYIPNASSAKYLNPDSAFQESLFDALADDEGAAFWEGVYGQPIHTYPSTRPGPEGELERMTDEEYTTFVRARMWDKSHGYVIEERTRREAARARRREWEEEGRRMESERRGFERVVEESLKRGEERRGRVKWREMWRAYLGGWEKLRNADVDAGRSGEKNGFGLKNRVLWPVESGGWKDVDKELVETFFRRAPLADNAGADLLGILKPERVRWHPDKIQQRFGSHGIEDGVMKAVTAVFQVIDRMWSELRENKT